MLQDGLRRLMKKDIAETFEYGVPNGYLPLRQVLARQLKQIGVAVSPSQIITTNGATGALDILGRYLIKPNDVVFVDDPGYYVFTGYAKSLGAIIKGVPRTPEGPDVEALEAMVKEHRPKLFFTMSVLHNPTGTSTTLAVAHRVLQIAEKHDFVIIEDDVYGDFHTHPMTRLATLDQLRRVIYVSGYSKTVSTGLRAGFIACREDMVAQFIDLKLLIELNTCGLSERLLHEVLEGGLYNRHLGKLQGRLEKARKAAIGRLREAGLEIPVAPEAGMFIWAKLKTGINAAELAARGAEKGIILGPGSVFRPHQEPSPWLRFNAAYCDDPRLYQFLKQARR
jgi:DNA-binding transcriptional MocR family regulator